MILIPNKKLVLPPPIEVGVQMKGFFRVQLINKFTGKCRYDTGFFPNKILDSGKNGMCVAQRAWLSACQVGRSAILPNAAQKALLDHVSGTTQTQPDPVRASSGVIPYYGYYRVTFRFQDKPEIANENLSEVGVGWDTTGETLTTRALIIDPVTQEPTTVTPLPDEVLDVTYEFRYYAPENDVVGPVVTLNGVDYNTVTRAADATGLLWYSSIGTEITQYSPYTTSWLAWDGDIGSVTQYPNGTSAAADNADHYALAYANNSYARSVGCHIGATGWNLTNDIRSVSIQTTAGAYQTRFGSVVGDNPIPKDNALVMGLRWKLSWSERPAA